MRILFIVKNREFPYTQQQTVSSEVPFSSGLYNSVLFVVKMLQENGIDANLAMAVDNNCIDRLVTEFRPDLVILEALWVVPNKLTILKALHPNVTWMVRLHSEVAFLGLEGIAIEWLCDYVRLGIKITTNSSRLKSALEVLFGRVISYSPNYYPIEELYRKTKKRRKEILDIGCFGAVRPLKNQLIQAIAAIDYGNSKNKLVRFHINGSRVECNGNPILKNLRALFANSIHELVEHDWLSHHDFLELLTLMDAVMQVSLTETFNIVAADAVANKIPVVASREIAFIAKKFQADPACLADIEDKLDKALHGFGFLDQNYQLLKSNSRNAVTVWKGLINLV